MIKTVGLTRKFGGLTAVSDLNLSVGRGEIFGFLGPNGAGKTTTIRILINLLRPTSGRAEIAGYDVQQESIHARRSIGYVAQTPMLYEKLTGREFLRFIGGLYGLSDTEIEERGNQLLKLLDLTDKADQLIASYSGGMRKKIALCSALLHRPPVLILDEPLSGLDPQSARRIKDVLRALADRGTTVFLSTHVLEIAERVCDRVAILDKGKLIAVGTLEELRSADSRSVEKTLEDLFLDLIGMQDAHDITAGLVG